MIYLGVDPGASGAMCLLNEDGEIHDLLCRFEPVQRLDATPHDVARWPCACGVPACPGGCWPGPQHRAQELSQAATQERQRILVVLERTTAPPGTPPSEVLAAVADWLREGAP